ncbi:MAG: sigma 54-interacting transcriptional regulator [Myxococcota bacterium]
MTDQGIDLSDFADDEHADTELLAGRTASSVRQFRLVGVEGPVRGQSVTSSGPSMSIGSDEGNVFVVDDPAVSRFHCEVYLDASGAWLDDQMSRNGSTVDGVPVGRGGLRDGSTIRIGRSVVRFELGAQSHAIPCSEATEVGTLWGRSVAMRQCFALLERASQSDVTVLLEGETGTGKEGAADALHRLGRRADQPLLVVDCGSLPPGLLQSELFGHARGAFTGAETSRAGVFEAAHGGTVFLDEIGELPLELQPQLLRVLEARTVRPLGTTAQRPVDTRIIAATNRDLRHRVNEGAFRSDLYFRLAVFKVRMPALRERPDDIPLLVRRFLDATDADAPTREAMLQPDAMARLQRGAWPGNVRELRNYVERCAVMQQSLPTTSIAAAESVGVDASLRYRDAKRAVLARFEREYLTQLLERHGGNVSAAARAAGMDRVYVYKLLGRHGLRPRRR